MCEKCGIREDEVLVQTSKDGEVLKTESLCMECFQQDIDDED